MKHRTFAEEPMDPGYDYACLFIFHETPPPLSFYNVLAQASTPLAMTNTGDLIDFDIIETHKENIQALPSGRSARSLARIFSPVASASQTQDINDTARAEFESEVATADESDDPLDIFDRYVKWTLDTYPSAQSTPSSQLLPLLERATKAFIKDDQYKNDPRYLKLWLHYIRFFSDAPRETFAYLSRHGVGEKLALYYEEFAAWLEANGRWAQAEEVYMMGTEKGARPAERLMRKLGEFHKRAAARAEDTNGPSSPALPVARAALAAKIDPYAAPATIDLQAQAAARSTTGTSKKAKMQIFSDDGAAPAPAVAGGAAGWDSIGNVKERKKENTVAAQPWAGQTLGVGSRSNVGMPKMPIFQDQVSRHRSYDLLSSSSYLR
jgi:checkpoint serine/threonine-protein kinase